MASHSAASRHKYTLQVLREHGHASVSRLSAQLGVSEVTIRKDLRLLEARNCLVRTHGGAVLMDHYLYDLPFDEKTRHRAKEKKRIGRRAAELVKDGDTLVLNAGSTNVQVARHLHGKRHLTIATNSVYVALELLNNLEVDVWSLGGILHPATAATVGPVAEAILKQHTFDWLFLAGDGFDIEHGLTTTNVLEAHLSRAMMKAARQTVAVLDATKFGRRGLTQVCSPHEVNLVVTDSDLSSDLASDIESLGVSVLIA